MYSDDFHRMSWQEFCALLGGLSGNSPLGRIVQIRAEKDKKVLAHYNRYQHKIRNDWIRKRKVHVTPASIAERDDVMVQILAGFRSMAK